jgi:hypothetical protein
MRRFATGSPRSIALAEDFAAAVSSLWRPTSAEELEAVGGAREHVLLGRLGLFLLLLLLLSFRGSLAHLEADALELAGQLLDLGLVEVVLDGERFELCGLEVSTLFGTLHKGLGLVGIKQFVKLVLCQLSLSALTL